MTTTSSAAVRSYWPTNGLAALLDFAAWSHRRAAAFLIVVALLFYLPGGPATAPPNWSLVATFWTALPAGILDKGPLILMFVGLAALTVSIVESSACWLNALRPVPGIIWLLVLVLPWLVATDPAGAADFLLHGGCRVAFIEARQERSFALQAEAIGLRFKAGPRIEGYNISNGQRIAVAVFRPADAPKVE